MRVRPSTRFGSLVGVALAALVGAGLAVPVSAAAAQTPPSGTLDPSPLPLPTLLSPTGPSPAPAPLVPTVPSLPGLSTLPSLPSLSTPSLGLGHGVTVPRATSAKPSASHLSANEELARALASNDDPTIRYDHGTVFVSKCSTSACERSTVPAGSTDGSTAYVFWVDAGR